MSSKLARETFKAMLNLCYTEEDYQELHMELLSLESETKKSKEPYKYETGMEEILNIIPLFADDFPLDVFSEIQEMYRGFLENKE